MNWPDETGEQRVEARSLVSPGTALSLSNVDDQLLAGTGMQWSLFPPLFPYILKNSMKNYTDAFETQNMLLGLVKGDIPTSTAE